MTTLPLLHPLSAACHPQPYAYYAQLQEGDALRWFPDLKLWVASRAAAVEAVLASPLCAVRPQAEKIPAAIAGSSAAQIFDQLIRMNEGDAHAIPKRVLQTTLRSLDMTRIAQRTACFADQLATATRPFDGAALTHWTHALPVYVVGDMLGFSADELPALHHWIKDFVQCLSPLSNAAQLQDASVAAEKLLQRFGDLVRQHVRPPDADADFITRVQREAQSAGWDHCKALLCNLIGLLSQTYEASAGLIGNALVLLHQRPELQAYLATEAPGAAWLSLVEEVCRIDSPVQNTRRFVEQDCVIAGVQLRRGDAVLLLLAAANRDPLANPDPANFAMQRSQRRLYSFGHGRHACPGQTLALGIAAAALPGLLHAHPSLLHTALQWHYRPSLNGRIPQFTQA
ncbi:MAG: cytochrome P450 [Burkholderiales bacterium]|nr:cytochrome P450 [Burkholderiales bacterium]